MNSNKDETAAAEKVLRTHTLTGMEPSWNLEGPQREGEIMMQGITLIWTQLSLLRHQHLLERLKPIDKQAVSSQ